MARQKLHFNGVRPNGEYGLAPMTAEDLADHIDEGRMAEEKTQSRLEKQLKRQEVKKLKEIVALLVNAGEDALKQDRTREAWISDIARDLIATLMGKNYAESGYRKELERQLQQAPSETLQLVVAYLADKKVKDLATFLLNPDLGTRTEFKEKLKFESKLVVLTVKKEFLGDERIAELVSAAAGEREVWLGNLLDQLRDLHTPMQAMTALSDFKYIVTNPAETADLLAELKKLAVTDAQWQAGLIALEAELSQGRKADWGDLVDALDTSLQGFIAEVTGVDMWEDLQKALSAWLDELFRKIGHLGVQEGVDPTVLSEAGWGIVFPARMSAKRRKAIRLALEPLLAWRLAQTDLVVFGDIGKYQGKSLDDLLDARAGKEFHPKYQEFFKIYEGGGQGVRPNDTARVFLGRQGVNPEDPANPDLVPYYLLLIGTPEEISFEFQYQLDVQYAVGRIDFDEIEDYHTYAVNVVAVEQAAEQGNVAASQKVTFFGVHNPGDISTDLSAEHLIKPLAANMAKKINSSRWPEDAVHWDIEKIEPADAQKDDLLKLLKEEPPAILFTASHGMEFSSGDARQVKHQGALLCQDWPGPHAVDKSIPSKLYFSGDDVMGDNALNMQGMIAFFFACYGAGTPLYDEFTHQAFKDKGATLAEKPFVAALPKAMLSLSEKGALAVIGHIERTWGSSFMRPEKGKKKSSALPVFESMLQRLLTGHPVGSAMDYFNVRYAALSTELTAALNAPIGREPSAHELAKLWTRNNDARGYIIVGDPAVRLLPTVKPV